MNTLLDFADDLFLKDETADDLLLLDSTGPPAKAPWFCAYADCEGYDFTLLGKVGDATFWRCEECGLDFAT